MTYAAGTSTQGKAVGASSRRRRAAVAAVLSVAGSLLLAALPARADPPTNNQQETRKEGRRARDFRDSRDNSRWEGRDPRGFEARGEEQRRMMEENNSNAEFSRRVGRMTADERRDLRRQINEAGQEVYALPPKR
jgi:hypothetical protein